MGMQIAVELSAAAISLRETTAIVPPAASVSAMDLFAPVNMTALWVVLDVVGNPGFTGHVTLLPTELRSLTRLISLDKL